MLSIRKVKTKSGSVAVQVVEYQGHKSKIIKHIGSVKKEEEISLLYQKAREFIKENSGQISLFPEAEQKILFIDQGECIGVTHQFARKLGVRNIIGADFSYNMLKLFNKKSSWIIGKNVQMVAENMPLKDNSVTNISVAFGVRNFYDIQLGFNSFFRVLKKSGKATIIEFRLPSNPLFRWLYKFYFKKILPLIGGLISGDKEAYSYLPNSVEEFDEKIDIPELLKISGFKKIERHSLTFGIVQVVIATK